MPRFTFPKQVGRVPEHTVPLSKSEEDRAMELHDKSIVFDLRITGGNMVPDSVDQLQEWRYWGMFVPETHQFGYEGLKAGGITSFSQDVGQFLCLNSKVGWRFEDLVIDLGLYLYEIGRHPEQAIHGLRAEDIRRAKREGKFAVFFTIENSEHIHRDLDRINVLHGLGVRSLMLSYNSMSFVANGLVESTAKTVGLTDFGHDYIARMNDVGMIVDATHSGAQATIEAAGVSRSPILLSHTGARRLHDTARLATDEVMHAVAEGGGVVGVHAGPNILSDDKRQGVGTVVDHIEYIARLIGVDHTGLGTDNQFGSKQTQNAFVRSENNTTASYIGSAVEYMAGIADPSQERNITRELVRRGYSDGEIEKMIGLNALRVYERAIG
ncbi:MAG: dipeptidase [Thaumarchaeota archaeon]|nr:dipeptidase [Nitrososphaerota archaeon]